MGEYLTDRQWLRWLLALAAASLGAIFVESTIDATLNLGAAAIGAFVSLAGFTLAGAAILIGLREHGQLATLAANDPPRWIEVITQLFRASRYALLAAVYLFLVSAFYEPHYHDVPPTPLNTTGDIASDAQESTPVFGAVAAVVASVRDYLVAAGAAFMATLVIAQTGIAITVLEAASHLSGTPAVNSKPQETLTAYSLPQDTQSVIRRKAPLHSDDDTQGREA